MCQIELQDLRMYILGKHEIQLLLSLSGRVYSFVGSKCAQTTGRKDTVRPHLSTHLHSG